MAFSEPVRIVLAKVGLDGHDRGIRVVARALRNAGFEVIYLGLRQTPATIAAAALQEDARLVGLSLHSGAHMTLLPAVLEELRRLGAEDIAVFGGGIIPADDVRQLEEHGIAKLFAPGAPLDEIIAWVNAVVGRTARV